MLPEITWLASAAGGGEHRRRCFIVACAGRAADVQMDQGSSHAGGIWLWVKAQYAQDPSVASSRIDVGRRHEAMETTAGEGAEV